MSSFSIHDSYTTCYEGASWVNMIFAFVMAPLFIGAVLRYTKIFKHYRKRFDFLDKGFYVVLEPYLKFIAIVG